MDAVYRICSPFRAGPPFGSARSVTFLAVELGLSAGLFASASDQRQLMGSGDPIVTPSTWSGGRLAENGIATERISVVPHGVDTGRFRPLRPEHRGAMRARVGVAEDETLFVNIAAPYWHKGTDLLLKAFAALRLKGLRVRLFVKDQRALYGRTLDDVIRELGRTDGRLLDERVVAGLTVFPHNLSPDEIAALIGIADCYVSPYRAEGFNLPVLEAIACGVPSIVTAGGATDDFCAEGVAIRLSARLLRKRERDGSISAFLEPDGDMLVDAMAQVASGARPQAARFESARCGALERCDWGRAADALVRVVF